MKNDAIIQLDNVSFAYEPNMPVLENVSLSFKEREFACLVGPNGGGKSTFLYLLLGFLKPNTGTISILGSPPIEARRKIGYMPQYIELDQLFPITVKEVVLLGRLKSKLWGFFSKKDHQIASQAMDEMGIANLANRTFSELSGGQRQRTLIARALACQPEILLLDEPTANIDPGMQEQFYDNLYELNKRMAILTVSHDLGFVSERIDSVICINRYVNVHPTNKLSGDIIKNIYGYDVNMIRHDYRCNVQH